MSCINLLFLNLISYLAFDPTDGTNTTINQGRVNQSNARTGIQNFQRLLAIRNAPRCEYYLGLIYDS